MGNNTGVNSSNPKSLDVYQFNKDRKLLCNFIQQFDQVKLKVCFWKSLALFYFYLRN